MNSADPEEYELTCSSDNLRFQTQLVLVPSSYPADLASRTHGDIRCPLDPVPHVSAGERQDQEDRCDSPYDPRLDDGDDNWSCSVDGHTCDDYGSGDHDEWDWVERFVEVKRDGSEMGDPSVKLIGAQASAGGRGQSASVVTPVEDRMCGPLSVSRTHCLFKSYGTMASFALLFGPVRTGWNWTVGAVVRPS